MEEPENGIHPANIPAMLNLLRDLAVDPSDAPGPDNPVRQVIVNTHSPVVVQVVTPDDLLFATSRPVEGDDRHMHQVLELRPMQGTWRAAQDGSKAIGKADLVPYLTTPPERQNIVDYRRVTVRALLLADGRPTSHSASMSPESLDAMDANSTWSLLIFGG